jgi:hypothetical protein
MKLQSHKTRLQSHIRGINTHRCTIRTGVSGLFLLFSLILASRLHGIDLIVILCLAVMTVFALRLCVVMHLQAAHCTSNTRLALALILNNPLEESCGVNDYTVDDKWMHAVVHKIPILAL